MSYLFTGVYKNTYCKFKSHYHSENPGYHSEKCTK